MTDHGLLLRREAPVKFKPVASLGQRQVERSQRIFRDRLLTPHAAVAEKQGMMLHCPRFYRAWHKHQRSKRLIEIEIADRFACIRRFLGLLHSFLKFLVEQFGSMLLRLDRLPEDGLAPAVLL